MPIWLIVGDQCLVRLGVTSTAAVFVPSSAARRRLAVARQANGEAVSSAAVHGSCVFGRAAVRVAMRVHGRPLFARAGSVHREPTMCGRLTREEGGRRRGHGAEHSAS
jgi:hypothetical protein